MADAFAQRLGEVALAMGEVQEARRFFRQAYQRVIDSQDKDWPMLLKYCAAHAMLLARADAAADRERAAELSAMVLHHPTMLEATRDIEMLEARDRAQRILDQGQRELSPEVFAAAQERGRARDLWATVQELLAELEH